MNETDDPERRRIHPNDARQLVVGQADGEDDVVAARLRHDFTRGHHEQRSTIETHDIARHELLEDIHGKHAGQTISGGKRRYDNHGIVIGSLRAFSKPEDGGSNGRFVERRAVECHSTLDLGVRGMGQSRMRRV